MQVLENQCQQSRQLEQIMVKESEVAAELRQLRVDNDQYRTEIQAKFARLEALILAGGDASPELITAKDELAASINSDKGLGDTPA